MDEESSSIYRRILNIQFDSDLKSHLTKCFFMKYKEKWIKKIDESLIFYV